MSADIAPLSFRPSEGAGRSVSVPYRVRELRRRPGSIVRSLVVVGAGLRRVGGLQVGEQAVEGVVAVVGEPGRLAGQGAVRVAFRRRELAEVVGDGREIAARDRPGERGARTEPEHVGQARLGERRERLERNAGRGREPLDLTEQRDEVVRRHDRGRVIARALLVGDRERAAARARRRAPRPAGHPRSRPTIPGAGRGPCSPTAATAADAARRRARRAAARAAARTRRARANPRGGRRARCVAATARPRPRSPRSRRREWR